MLAGGHGGAIVNVGSVNSFLGFPTGSAYVSSKHGLIGLTTSVSAELAPQRIRVNLVGPGFIDTPMHHRARGILGNDMYALTTGSYEACRPPGGDRPNYSLPVLGRG